MKKTSFWNKMKILSSSTDKIVNMDNLFISDEKPEFVTIKQNYTKKNRYSEKDLQQISDFYRYNFRLGKSNDTIFVPKTELEKILAMRGEIITIYKEDNLIGSIISYEVPISINININVNDKINSTIYDDMKYTSKDIIFGCTTSLILHKKYRGTGLGIALIQESLQLMYETGTKVAYFINNVSRCNNSIPITNWYYPLNLEKLDACHYVYPREFRNRFELTGENLSVNVNNRNLNSAHAFYTEIMKKKPFYFSPSIDYYQKWIERFKTYVVIQNNCITGLYSFNHRSIWYPSLNTVLEIGYLITCIGFDTNFVIQQALLQGKKSFDLMVFQEIGDIKADNLDKIFAQRNFKTYVNFFNTPIRLKPSDFYAPVL